MLAASGVGFHLDGSLLIPRCKFAGLDPSRRETHTFRPVIRLVRFGAELDVLFVVGLDLLGLVGG